MNLSTPESIGLKAFGVVAGLAGLNFAVKRLEYNNDPQRSEDPMMLKGITWTLTGLLFFISYKALTLKSE